MKKYLVLLLLPAAVIFQFCGSSKKSSSKPIVKTTFDTDVKPLISTKCTPCHTTGNKKHLENFDTSKVAIDDVIARIKLNPGDKGFMPFKHDKLTDSVINVFVKWKADGLLEK